MVRADISNPKTSVSKIIDLKRPVDECSDIEFSALQNAERQLCDTLNKLVH